MGLLDQEYHALNLASGSGGLWDLGLLVSILLSLSLS